MTLLEDLNSGKYNLVLVLVLVGIILLFNQHCTKSTEKMGPLVPNYKDPSYLEYIKDRNENMKQKFLILSKNKEI